MGALPPVFIEFLGRSTGFMATSQGVKRELRSVEAEGGGNMARLGAVSKAALLGVGIAAGVAAVKTVHMAADFQTQMTRVRTGAGEAAKNMSLVGNGVLHMAGQVGESTKELTAGLYMVESAGFHGQNALDVLRVSAMGAKVGAADLATVTDAVTTAMNAYNLQSANAAVNTQHTTDVMNALVGTEAEGKTNLEALAGSMSGILPVAAAAHVRLNEVLGAMATMTSQGTEARVAATYLRQTIGQLSNATPKAAATMKGLGLSATDVAKELGSKGLAATLTTLTDAIKRKMGPDGTVLIDTLQKAAKSGKDFQSALNRASGSQKTYIGALATMVGGTKSMMGALQLTGPHMATFRHNVDGIAQHVRDGGKHVEGWSDVQKTFNQRMAEFKGTAQAIGIEVGQHLLPPFTTFVGWLTKGLLFLASHGAYLKTFGVLLAGVTIGLASASLASWSFTDSLLANPITWVVAGIVALVAGLAYLLVHWKQVWSWIKTNIPVVATAFRVIWAATLKAFHLAWDWAMKAVHALVKWFDANVLKWLKARVKDFTGWWKSHSTEIHLVWQAMWKAVQVDAKIIFAWLGVAFNLLGSTITIAWHLIVNVIKVAWSLISGITTTTMHLVMNVIGVVLDLITGHWSKAWHDLLHLASQSMHDIWSTIKSVGSSFGNLLVQAGRDMINGLVSGIKSAAGAVGSTMESIAKGALSSVKSALGINSPSRVMRDEVGKWIPHGVAEGVRAHAGHAYEAIRDTATGMVTEFSSALGIASPSKVFRSLGIWIHTGLADGLTGSLSKVKSAIKRTETLLMEAMNRLKDLRQTHGVRSQESAVKRLEAYVNREGKQLQRLASQREDAAKKLKAAQSQLKAVQKSWTKERDSVASNIMSGASIVMSPKDDGGALTAGDVLGNLQSQASAAMQFSQNLTALRSKGLSADLIAQIAGAGVDGGAATAQALLTANKSQIDQINMAQKNMATAAKSTGGAVADAMYGAGIHSAEGLIKGLQSKEKAITKQMEKIAKAMATAIKKELGIKSPSRVFHEIGRWITAGLVGGVDAGERDVRDASYRMSHALIGGVSAPTLSGSAVGTRAVTIVHQVQVDVHGSVRSDRDLRDVIQTEMQRFGGRNSVTYQQFKR